MIVDSKLNTLLTQSTYEVSVLLSEKFNVNHDEVLKTLSDYMEIPLNVFDVYKTVSKKEKKITITSDIEEVVSESPCTSSSLSDNREIKNSKTNDNNLCSYIYTKGSKKGMRCTIKAKNGEYCCRHKK